MTLSLLYPVATLAWIANIVGARARAQGWRVSPSTGAFLIGAVAVVIAIQMVRRRVPSRPATLLRYACWIPLVYLTLFYDNHSLVPRVPLLLTLAVCATADTATGAFAGPFLLTTTLLGLIVIVDAAWRAPTPAVLLEKHPPRYWQPDPALGYRPLVDTDVSITCWRKSRRVYQVSCTFDEFGRRRTPDDPEDRPVAHAIFMGNSCVFGENVADDQTLPSHFAAQTTGFAVYNYGFIGWGPQQMLALLQSGQLRAQVPQRSGLLLYGLLPDHVRRVNGSYTATAWGGRFPRYVLRDGDPVHAGSFADSQPRRIAWFNLLRSSPALDYVARRIDDAWGYTPSRWRMLLEVVRRSKVEYERRFDGSFVVFIWPFGGRHAIALADSLTSRGIRVLDLAAIGVPSPQPNQLVPYDAHPAGAYYATVAEALRAADPLGQHHVTDETL